MPLIHRFCNKPLFSFKAIEHSLKHILAPLTWLALSNVYYKYRSIFNTHPEIVLKKREDRYLNT